MLQKQIGTQGKVHVSTLRTKWRGLSLNKAEMGDILAKGGWQDSQEVDWPMFLAVSASGVAHEGGIPIAMKIICEAHSDLAKGEGFAMATSEFIEMFKLVAKHQGLEEDKMNEVIEYLESAGAKQGGILSFENFKADLCPPLN